MPKQYEHYTPEDFIDHIDDLEDQVVLLKMALTDLDQARASKEWAEDFVAEVKSYLDWRESPNVALSAETQASVERTMLSLLQDKIAEIK
jgi:hypothetical protein|tara:strand:+ start:521 stop:790 length:270 start_codon:yes stop_codon:yes gene_type:complete